MTAGGTQHAYWRVTAIILGLAFLYVPLVAVIVYSFNASRLVTVWAGFSLRWYGELLNDGQIMRGGHQPPGRGLIRHNRHDHRNGRRLCARPFWSFPRACAAGGNGGSAPGDA